VEVAGHEALVHVRVGGDVLVARTTPDRAPQAGSRLQLAFRVGGIHAFDAASGNRLKAG
jgi:ABC-type sugar transport system ATPase subunit